MPIFLYIKIILPSLKIRVYKSFLGDHLEDYLVYTFLSAHLHGRKGYEYTINSLEKNILSVHERFIYHKYVV